MVTFAVPLAVPIAEAERELAAPPGERDQRVAPLFHDAVKHHPALFEENP